MGYLLRSGFNISLFGCGAEENNPSDNVPVNMNISFQSFENGVLYTSILNDIGGNDLKDNYKGSNLYIYGGRNLYIPNFFSTEPGGYNPGVNPGLSRTTHITILGNARAVYLTNPRLTGQSRVVNPIRIERFPQSAGSPAPRDVNLFFNPTDDRPDDGTTWYSSAPNFVFTRSGLTTSCTGIIMDQGINTEVKNGATFYRPFVYTPDPIYTVSTPFKSILGLDNSDKILPLASILVSETIYIPIPSYMGGSTIYVSPVGISTSPDSNLLALCPPGQNKKILAFSLMGTGTTASEDTIQLYLYTTADVLLHTFTGTTSFPANVTLASPISVNAPWAIKIVPTGYGGTFKSIALAVINY
jgi:hypothetical protein